MGTTTSIPFEMRPFETSIREKALLAEILKDQLPFIAGAIAKEEPANYSPGRQIAKRIHALNGQQS